MDIQTANPQDVLDGLVAIHKNLKDKNVGQDSLIKLIQQKGIE
jgi:hypothetical protein